MIRRLPILPGRAARALRGLAERGYYAAERLTNRGWFQAWIIYAILNFGVGALLGDQASWIWSGLYVAGLAGWIFGWDRGLKEGGEHVEKANRYELAIGREVVAQLRAQQRAADAARRN